MLGMDNIQKKKLCPNDVSPRFEVLCKVGCRDIDKLTSEWRKDYGSKIFYGDSISFYF
jgi:hypothetical protein